MRSRFSFHRDRRRQLHLFPPEPRLATIYTSGLLPLGKDGKLIGAMDIKAQTRAVLENIKAVLGAGGGTTEDLTFSQVFITDLTNFKAMKRSLFRVFQEGPSDTLLHSLRFGSA